MEKTEMICILCPMGCRLAVEKTESGVIVTGNSCKRGEAYGEQELLNPMRMVTSSVRISGGQMPTCPVKTASQVPKNKIEEVLCAIRQTTIKAPVHVGDILTFDIAGTGVDLVATANRLRAG